MLTFPKYDSYKNSGVTWIGEIPEHWKVLPFKSLFQMSLEKNGGNIIGEMLSVSGYRGIEIKHYEYEEQKRTARDLVDYRVVRKDQLVVNTMWLNYAGLGVSEIEGHVSPAYRAYWISDQLHKRYTHYLLRSHVYVEGYTGQMQGIRPNSLQIKNADFHRFPILVPTYTEQGRIAAFLDEKTREIDEAIAKKQRLIELLQEQKAILINNAVTKGLDPDVPMRESGVEWIGRVPAHWEVKKIKFIFESTDYGLSESALSDGVYKYLNMGHIQDGQVLINDTGFLNKVPEDLLLENGDILFNRTNSFDLVGKSGIFQGEKSDKVTFASYLVRLRVKTEYDSSWANYMLNDYSFLLFIRSLALRSLHQANLNPNRLRAVHIPVPPFEEQVLIAQALKSSLAKYDAQIRLATETIARYHELNQTMISEAVTGKIKI